MLDRLDDSSAQNWDGFEPLPPGWRGIFEALQASLARGADERGHLARALERTATELREQLVELDALRRARCAAESTNLVRGQILATVSRTMRRPADAVLGLTGLLRLEALAPRESGYVEELHRAAEALRGILNDVSDFSSLESGTLPLEPISFDLRLMVEDLAATLAAEVLLNGITVRVEWSPQSPYRVIGDPGRIRQILAALVHDAFARLDRGEVVVTVREDPIRQPEGIQISVADSGPGIPADLLPSLFEPFAQDTERDGGLALPIARELAHLMGGELRVETQSGAGTRFWLRVPLQRPDASWVTDTGFPSPLAAGRRGSLLVMEADPRQRERWSAIAEAAGYRAEAYPSHEQLKAELARRAREGTRVDVVIFSDHDAEEYERLGRELTTDDRLGKPAMVMLTAAGNPGDGRRLRDAGFRGYLVKPVAPSDLRAILETLQRTPRESWHRLFLTRHSLAEARLGEVAPEVVDAELTGLLET